MINDVLLQPNLGTAALITVDVQRDTLDGAPCEIPGTSAALPAMVELVRRFRRLGQPIVHVVRLYVKDGSNVDLCRRSAVVAGGQLFLVGSGGSQLADGLPPAPGVLDHAALLAGKVQRLGAAEVVMYKPRWGAFFETPLQAHLSACEVDTLVFCGANFPNCPRTSVYEASERDYRVVLAADATSRLSGEGIRELEGIGVHVWSARRVVDELEAAPSCVGR